MKKRGKIRDDEWARSGLDRVLPLIECIAFMHNGLDNIPEPLAPLKLVPSGDSRFGLE